MRIETKTKGRVHPRTGEAEVWLTINLLPRGSGNRSKARGLAAAARANHHLEPFIKRVIVGASKVVVVFRADMGLGRAITNMEEEMKGNRDIPGQLSLFAS